MFGALLEVAMSKKVQAVVARSTFHFWTLRCSKSVRGAKHISKSKCTKHTKFGPLLEVEMPEKCTPLWREAHFKVKMYKAPHARTTFEGFAKSERNVRVLQHFQKRWQAWDI